MMDCEFLWSDCGHEAYPKPMPPSIIGWKTLPQHLNCEPGSGIAPRDGRRSANDTVPS